MTRYNTAPFMVSFLLAATCLTVPSNSWAARQQEVTDERTLEYYRAFPLADRSYRMRARGQDAEAIDQMRKAVNVLPQNLQYRLDLAQWLKQEQRYQEALGAVNAGLHYHPNQQVLLDLQRELQAEIAPPVREAVSASEAEAPAKSASTQDTAADEDADKKVASAAPKEAAPSVEQEEKPLPAEKAPQPMSAPKAAPQIDPCNSRLSPAQLTAAQNMQAAYCALQAQNRALAVKHFKQVRETGDAQSRLLATKELGYLYSQQGDETAASEMWASALQEEDNASIAINRARSLRVQKHYAEAEAALKSIDADNLPNGLHVLYLEEQGYLADTMERTEQAIASGDALLQKEPTAERYYQQALRYQQVGNQSAAIAALEEATVRAPEKRLYAVSLAYAYRQADRNADAIPLFAYGLQNDDYISARGDYAYALKNEGQREEAAQQFRLKLDEELPSDERYALRREVQQLEDNWVSVGSITYRDGVARASGAPGVQSYEDSFQYGLETVYSPDDWQRDGRRVQFYGQVFTSSDTGEFNYNADSTQGAVGVRATPLANTEWYVYAARLFAVGDDALDDWQLRTTYAYTKGFDYDPTRQSWEYLFFTPDISYLVDKEELFATVEGRYGRSYRLKEGSHWVMTPHLVTAAAHQHSPQQSRDALELGVGLSAKYWFDESEKRAPRGSAELILQWREPIAGSEDQGGPFLRFVLQY